MTTPAQARIKEHLISIRTRHAGGVGPNRKMALPTAVVAPSYGTNQGNKPVPL
jgi:hypothetical protein